MIWIFAICKKYIQQIWVESIGYCYKNKTKYWEKAASKKVVYEKAEAAGEFIGSKSAEKFKECWRNKYYTRRKRKNTEQIKKSIIKWNTIKYLNC